MEARDLIVEADKLRQEQNLSQAEWSRAAGFDDSGVAICRTFARGNCKLTMLLALLRPLGYELQIRKKG